MVDIAVSGLDEKSYSASTLPGWTRRNLVAHLSANAVAVGNLVHWAATGEPTPMYTSMAQRDADIEAGGSRSGEELTASFRSTAAQLEEAMDALADEQWAAEVMTAQGRSVPAAEIPWLRSREVMVHAVDLGTGLGFAELPADFLAALCHDIVAKRSTGAGPALEVVAADHGDRWSIPGQGDPVSVTGTLAGITAYLSGRVGEAVARTDGSPAPALPAWL